MSLPYVVDVSGTIFDGSQVRFEGSVWISCSELIFKFVDYRLRHVEVVLEVTRLSVQCNGVFLSR